MRNRLAIILTLITMFVCCRRSTLNRSIAGKWQFIYATGGFSGSDTINPPLGTTIILSLNLDKTYEKSSNGEVVFQGRYDLVNLESIYTRTWQPAILFDNLTTNTALLINLKGNSLNLMDNHVEPYTYLYNRLK